MDVEESCEKREESQRDGQSCEDDQQRTGDDSSEDRVASTANLKQKWPGQSNGPLPT
ncbi:hypothetical protein RvY_14895 [Ramazzottius varieornatus]|uniref:Uncharacterized protein n=1 Tax=Ramazzottius varieornatus TaxID=947166 RepID=A0A1D1VSV8_RAMVA|nr:hypothetical protein RvY_14895 [Ramazzottius varieornatus]